MASLGACTPPDPGTADTPSAVASPVVEAWALPTPAGAAQPDLVAAPDGTLLLSWLEPAGEDALRFRLSQWRGDAASAVWTAPVTIAEGDDFFRNWADTPHVFALQDGSLWAHWLRSTGPSRMDYGIDLVRSGDGGATWTSPQFVHPSGTSGDHGFVTFWPQSRDRLGIAWLDSRQKAAAGHTGHDGGGHDHAGSAAMMLRAATYDTQAKQMGEWPLDVSTCDCCTTASAVTDRGAVVVYRGRSAGEIRDTRIVRFDGERWTPPRDVHTDGWQIAGCPVNGPVVVAKGSRVWVAWYTEAEGVPELRAARSDDAGDTFAEPVTLAKGTQVLGRLALALAGDHLLASWLEQTPDERQSLVLGRYDAAWTQPQRVEVATLSARGRASGIPRMQWRGDAAWLAWVDVDGEVPRVLGARVVFP
ncbi:sialidase family protein [Pseudoxanthomonas sp. LjRoot143]|uniref:sialidase family protein n=1 Tax=Pseudoxanthomonas sp. LjRoot143 TaxID=3342266 RepID=UPI003ECF226E